MNFWKDTRVGDALNYLRNTKQAPIGGTSAGCAIQGATYYSALNGSVTPAWALTNSYNADMTLGRNDFLANPYLSNVVADTHFNNPDRRRQLVAFMARMSRDNGVLPAALG